VADGTGYQLVFGLVHSGLFPQLPDRAHYVRLAWAQASAFWNLPQERAPASRAHAERAQFCAAVVAHERRLESRVLFVVEVHVVMRQPDAVPHLAKVQRVDVEELFARHAV